MTHHFFLETKRNEGWLGRFVDMTDWQRTLKNPGNIYRKSRNSNCVFSIMGPQPKNTRKEARNVLFFQIDPKLLTIFHSKPSTKLEIEEVSTYQGTVKNVFSLWMKMLKTHWYKKNSNFVFCFFFYLYYYLYVEYGLRCLTK